MEAAAAPRQGQWTFAQWGIAILASLQLLWATAGVAAALFATWIWAFFDQQPARVFTFPNNHSDAFFHIGTGVLFAIIALVQIAQDRHT